VNAAEKKTPRAELLELKERVASRADWLDMFLQAVRSGLSNTAYFGLADVIGVGVGGVQQWARGRTHLEVIELIERAALRCGESE
jgi:hypothetical protein